jgi:hypothetical protein
MLKKGLVRLAVLVALGAAAATAQPQLEDGFRNPPSEARLRCYWWWLNGNVTREAITRDLEEMKAKGFAGAIIVDAGGAEQRGNRQVPAGPRFAGPEWRVLFRHALREADRLGLEMSLNILSGWNLGGPTVKPESAAKHATWSRTQVRGPGRIERVLEAPMSKFGFYRDAAVVAYPLRNGTELPRPIRQMDLKAIFRESGMSMPPSESLLTDIEARPGEEDTHAGQVVDLTARMDASGRLDWEVPAGEWEILRFGYTPSGAEVSTSSERWQGLAIDYLDPKAFETYWRDVVAPLVDDAKSSKSLKYLVTDSWELGGVNWTPALREEFRARRGYDLLPYLPVFAGRLVESRDASNRFLNDLRRTVADLIADRHYKVFAAEAERSGLGIHPESGGPHGAPIDALLDLGIGAFPQMEFWAKAKTHRVRDDERLFVKEAASAAHIYGKRLVAAEGETSIGPQWEESIWDNLKPTFDRAVCEGLNVLVWHTFTCSPKEMGRPGQEYFAGTHFNPNITWWNQSTGFLSYINRVQFLMQQGLFVADVLYYYGDHVPNFVRLKAADPARVLPGYDYDVCNEDVLLHRVSVKDGRLVLPDGMSYRVLVLPDVDVISPAAMRKVRDLIAGGATVVGRVPRHSSGLLGEEEVAKIAEHLVPAGTQAREILAAKGIQPDFEVDRAGVQIDYIHRRAGDADIYFVSNQGGSAEALTATFRVAGKAPELWIPETGAIQPLFVYDSAGDGRTKVRLRLDPYGSAMVVFRKPAGEHFTSVSGNARVLSGLRVESETGGDYVLGTADGGSVRVRVASPPPVLPVTGAWTVRFTPGWRAPESTVFNSLSSWTEHSNPGVKYYAGTATYEKNIEIPAEYRQGGGRLELDLGDVREIAEVWLNGTNLGIVWKAPRTVDITRAAKSGANQLRVQVTNLWPNRLIGDQFLPEGERLTKTNITKFTRESPLLPSGLLGPAVIRKISETAIR